MMKSSVLCVGYKNTIAIVSGAQKDRDKAFFNASVYVRLHKPGSVFCFLPSHVAGKKNKHTLVFRFPCAAAVSAAASASASFILEAGLNA